MGWEDAQPEPELIPLTSMETWLGLRLKLIYDQVHARP